MFSEGSMSLNWSHSYDRKVSYSEEGNLTNNFPTTTIVRQDGTRIPFIRHTNGNWVSDSDINHTLTEIMDAGGTRSGWTVLTDRDVTEQYDVDGKLLQIVPLNTQAITMTYVAAGGVYPANAPACQPIPGTSAVPVGKLACVTDTFGRQLSFAYDLYGLSRMMDPQGNVYQYGYADSNVRSLASVVYPDGKVKQYLYETMPYTLTGIIDENNNRYATYSYRNTDLRAYRTEHAGGADAYTVSYGDVNFSSVTDSRGTVRTKKFVTINGRVRFAGVSQPGGAGCGPAASDITLDANGNVVSRTDFNGNVTSYIYDLTRNLETSRTEAFGTPLARTITTAWHLAYRLPAQISEPGRTTTFTYDERGNLLQRTITSGVQTRTWSYTYNPWGQVMTMDGPRTDVSDVTHYEYDSRGNLTRVTNPLGHVTQIVSYDANGRPLAIIDPNLIATQLTYDARGRLTRRAVENEVTTYVYDAAGQLIQLNQPDGNVLTYTYDPAHRLIGISDGQGNRISYNLDPMGNHTKEDVLDPTGTLARTRTQAYDSLSRLAQVLDSQNHATSYSYDANGNLTATTDASGARTSNSYDPLNRLIQTLDPLGGATRTQYDSLDQVVAVTDPIGVSTAYQVDGLGNVGGESSPDSGSTASTYDSAGNLLTRTDATGQTLSYAYDALNRLIQISSGSGPLVSYAWDGGSIGKLAQIQDPSGSTRYSYDPLGRISTKTQTQGSLTQSVSYAYAPGGLLAQLTTPGGNLVGYAYAGGKPASVSLNGQPLLSGITHEPHGPVSGWTWGSGQPHIRAHGLDGELQRIESAVATTYGYDAAGRMTGQHLWSQVSPPQNDTLNQYTLDPLGRLTGSSNTLTPAAPGTPFTDSLAYAYDANGNRQTLSWNGIPTSYTYSANRLTQSTGADNKTYAYDGAGRMVGEGRYTYTYDVMGRLSTVTDGGGTILVSYRYNALGQRVAKDGNGTVNVPGSLTLLYDSFAGPENRPIDDQDDNLWKGGGKKNTVAKVINGQAVVTEGKQIQSKSEFAEGEGLTLTATLVRGRVGLLSASGNLMVKYDGNKTITVNSDDSEDTEDPARAKLKAAQGGSPLNVEITIKQGKGRARITAGSESFDSGEVPVAQNQNWRIRLAAVKVKKTAMTGIVDEVSLKQATQGQTTQSGRRFVYDEAGHLVGEYDPTGKMVQEIVWLNDLPVASVRPKSAGGMEVFYIHPDHLGTPRQVTDQTNRIVWRWDTVDAFGVELPNEDPDRDGILFEFNLRFPGQYYDRETGRHYNYFRDYDPGTGRYTTSDPIGLKGGINIYLYGEANPGSKTDLLGLETYQCIRGLGQKPGGYVSPGNVTHHQYSCITLPNGASICGGQGPSGNPLSSPGVPTTPDEDYLDKNSCRKTQDDNQCFEKCLQDEWSKPRPRYSVLPGLGTQCQQYDDDVNATCRKKCGLN